MLQDMRRALTLTLAVALFGILAAVVVAQVGQDPAAPTGTTTAGTTTEDHPQDLAALACDIEIDRPVDQVAAFAGDPPNAPRWYTNIKSVEWLTEPPVAVGAKLDFVDLPGYGYAKRSQTQRAAWAAGLGAAMEVPPRPL